mgnify:CR=1 FL=1
MNAWITASGGGRMNGLIEKNVVAPRPVTLGSRVAGGIIIKAGLKAGERVIVDGLFAVAYYILNI